MRQSLEHQVKHALSNLYDQAYLQTSPLARLVPAAEHPGESTAVALRRLLRGAIESLRPPDPRQVGGPEWVGYEVLWLHYVHRKPPEIVGNELGLGRSSYYRAHQLALGALASLLWERYHNLLVDSATPETPPPAVGPMSPTAQQEALRLAQSSPREPVDPVELLRGVYETVLPLAQQEGIELSLEMARDIPPTWADHALLRQALVSLVVQAMDQLGESSAPARLKLSLQAAGGQIRGTLSGLPSQVPELHEPPPTRQPPDGSGFAFAHDVLEAYGGQLDVVESKTGRQVLFALPVGRPRSVLIVDDDGDAIALYRRWLDGPGYDVRVARTPGQLAEQLADARPDLVVLDVLMPQWDGWSALQQIRAKPDMRHVPVMVISVLSQPRLALALGASCALRKPLAEPEFLRTVTELLARAGSSA